MTYLYNRWYAADWSDSVEHAPKMRLMLDEPVLYFRDTQGRLVALSDRCPHRFAPLHRGVLIGDAIRCPYHGLQFDASGRCVDNPIGAGVCPAAAHVKTYPALDRHGIVWLWFGDQEPDPDLIVPLDYLDQDDAYDFIRGDMAIAANYALISDNLLDLSHAEFLHPNLGNPGANKRVKFTSRQDGDTVYALNDRRNEPPTGLMRLALGERAGDVIDMWSNVRWDAPAVLTVEVGGHPIGGSRADCGNTIAAHLITPATQHTSHYFWCMARNFARGDADLDARLTHIVSQAFETEDKPIIEAQQRYMSNETSLAAAKPVLLQSDAGAVRARRILERLIAEQTVPPQHKNVSA